eukprot:2356000-Rhodomonas_salina.2
MLRQWHVQTLLCQCIAFDRSCTSLSQSLSAETFRVIGSVRVQPGLGSSQAALAEPARGHVQAACHVASLYARTPTSSYTPCASSQRYAVPRLRRAVVEDRRGPVPVGQRGESDGSEGLRH